MKKTDIAMIILIASISLVAAYFIMSAFLGKYNQHSADIQIIDSISGSIEKPNPKIFYKGAINPTVKAIIGSEYEENQ